MSFSLDFAAGPDRRFGAALALSVAAHFAAMMLSPPAQKAGTLDRPLAFSVQLVQQPAPPVAELTHPVRPAATKPVRPKPAPRKHEKTTAALAVTPQPSGPVETTEAIPVMEEALVGTTEPAPPPSIAASLLPAPEPVATLAPAPVAVPRAPSAEVIALYTKSLSEMFARYKEYPRIAALRGWEGSVTMRLRVAPSGRLVGAEVLKSSGYDALDQQAIAMVSKAGALPVPPAGLNGADFAVLVPIDFRLER